MHHLKSITAKTLNLAGSSYEIGRRQGELAASSPRRLHALTSPFPGFGREDYQNAEAMFNRFCPGLNEELAGFADACGVPVSGVLYHAMTYLHPNCSQIALLPSRTSDGHPLLARSYEFNDEMEDFTLVKTAVDGKFTHLGTSAMTFGRDDGLNSEGLAVTMSSCGFPVGAPIQMRRPAVFGLQFWAVIRSLLENCRSVEDALAMLREIPCAYNLNLILMDRGGHAALVETLDGRIAVKEAADGIPGSLSCLYAANHACLEEISQLEPLAMAHSLTRSRWIRDTFSRAGRKITREDLKNGLLALYPHGLACRFYEDFFGTTKSLILDPAELSLEICWGGRAENGWQRYYLAETLNDGARTVELSPERADPELFSLHSVNSQDLILKGVFNGLPKSAGTSHSLY